MRIIRCHILILFLVAPGFAQQFSQQSVRTINTSGDAVIYVTPDEVIVNLGVETFHNDLEQCRTENTESCTKLLAAIKSLGIEDKNVQTDTMEVEIEYNNEGSRRGTINGYYCRRGYQITLKDTTQFEKLITTSLQNGANHLMGFEFRTTQLRKYRDEARQMAIKAAKEKATALAEELGAHLGKPRSISDNSYGYSGYQSSWWGGNRYGGMAQNVSANRSDPGAEGGDTVRLGQIAVSAQVAVTFDLMVD